MKFILPIFSGVLLSFASVAQTTVFNEDFEAGIPSSWTISIEDTNQVATEVSAFAPGWIGLVDPLDNTNHIAGATSYFRYAGTANRWLISPVITLGGFGNILKWRARSHDPSFAEDYRILISTTDTAVESFTDTLSSVFLEWEDWTEHEVNLSEAGYNSQNVYIAFVLKTYDGFKFYLDDVNMRKDDPVGVEENLSASVLVYPNPAASSFSVQGAASSIRLISLTGSAVLSQEITGNEKIDISDLNAGTYIAEITTANGIVRKKVVKK